MNKYVEVSKHILNSHPIKKLFNVKSIDYTPGNIALRLNSHDELSKGVAAGGTFGCIVDCVARMVGQESIGNCFVSEYEINFHSQPLANEFFVTAKIGPIHNEYAVYSCKIFTVDKSANKLVAEAQGTLIKNNVQELRLVSSN